MFHPVTVALHIAVAGVLVFVAAWVSYKAFGNPRQFVIVGLNGLTLAGLYFVVASGFTLIFGLMRVVNMAHGSLYMLAGFFALQLQKRLSGDGGSGFGSSSTVGDWILPLVLACLSVALIGLVMQQVFLRWNQGQDLRQALITIAISIIIADQALAHFGGIAEEIAAPDVFPDSVALRIYGLTYPFFRIFVLLVAIAVGLALWAMIKRTRFGMIVRAGVDDRQMVSALGINIQLVFAGAFFLGAFLAGLGGVLGGTMISVDKGNDTTYLLFALIVVIIGGMGRLAGAAIGALALGLVDAFGDVSLPAGYTNYSVLLIFGAIVLVLLFAPLLFTDFYLSAVITKALWLGIAAASLIFLAGYVGMISLGQVALYGVAGFTMANLVAADGGSPVTWNPWLGALAGILVCTGVGLFFGAIASRSYGIYFLMITLAFAVLTFLFFGQVTQLSGFGGVNNVDRPDVVSNPVTDPANLFYIALGTAAAVYLLIRYLGRTPFGLALQGIRDDPSRMRALGYNVPLLRMLAFGLGALIASLAGILSVWWNTRISPGSIDLARTLDVLIIAVIGGLYRLEGAWVGAIVFTVLDNWTRGLDVIGGRFNTVIGVIFLVIVLLSPGGLMGIWQSITDFAGRRLAGTASAAPRPVGEKSHPS